MQIEDPMLEDQQPAAQSSKKRKADPSKDTPATPHPKKQAKAEADSQEKPRSAPASAPAAVTTKQKKSDKAAAAVAPASQVAAAQKPSKAAAASAAGASQAAAAEAEAPLSKSQLKKQRKKAQEAGSAAALASDAPGTHVPYMCSATSLLIFEAVKKPSQTNGYAAMSALQLMSLCLKYMFLRFKYMCSSHLYGQRAYAQQQTLLQAMHLAPIFHLYISSSCITDHHAVIPCSSGCSCTSGQCTQEGKHSEVGERLPIGTAGNGQA